MSKYSWWLLFWALTVSAGSLDDLVPPSQPAAPASRDKIDADYTAGDWVPALLGYQAWVKDHPDDEEAWFRLGNLQVQAVRPMEALVAYRRAQKLKPDDARAWHNMGMLYLRLAIESYDNLRRNVPPDDPLVPYSERVLSGILDLVSLRMQQESLTPLKPLVPQKKMRKKMPSQVPSR